MDKITVDHLVNMDGIEYVVTADVDFGDEGNSVYLRDTVQRGSSTVTFPAFLETYASFTGHAYLEYAKEELCDDLFYEACELLEEWEHMN